MSYEKPPKGPRASDGDKSRTFVKDISSDEEEAIKKMIAVDSSSDSSSEDSSSENSSVNSKRSRSFEKSKSKKNN